MTKREELLALADRISATPSYTGKDLRTWRTPILERCDGDGDGNAVSVILVDAKQREVLVKALRAAADGAGVKLKPLEWNEYTDERGDPDRWDAETLAGTFYGIALLFDGFSIEYDYTAVAKGLDDLESAKAAAQADYERRVLSALEGDAVLATGLVAGEAAIRADEREKCARIAEATKVTSSGHPQIDAPTPGGMQRAIASAIRTGGQK